MSYEPFQEVMIHWSRSSWRTHWSANISFCRQGLRALLGERLDRDREYEMRAYLRRPRTKVREIEITRGSSRGLRWQVKGVGRPKGVPFNIRDFLEQKFQVIGNLQHDPDARAVMLYVRAIPGKKVR